MILADKIITLRKKNGWSQEELAEKLGVSRQSVSKWESTQSVPDLNRILQMSDLFGVSTDVLLKDDLELEDAPAEPQEDPGTGPAKRVSMELANAYLAARKKLALRNAFGVLLCIASAVPLLMFGDLWEGGRLSWSENEAGIFGVICLLVMVGIGVAIFIYNDMKMRPYDFINREPIETEYGVDGMVREQLERYRTRHILLVVLGVFLCIVATVPLLMSQLGLATGEGMHVGFGVACLLEFVALGVFFLVWTGIRRDSFSALLEDGSFTREHKAVAKRNSTIFTIYWLSMVVIYLFISFLTNRWDRSWIVWPVAGVGSAILVSVLSLFTPKKK